MRIPGHSLPRVRLILFLCLILWLPRYVPAACHSGCANCAADIPYSTSSAGNTVCEDACADPYPGLQLSQADLFVLRHKLSYFLFAYQQYRSAMYHHFEMFQNMTPYSDHVDMKTLGPLYAEDFQKIKEIEAIRNADDGAVFLMKEAKEKVSFDNLAKEGAGALVEYAMEYLGVPPLLMPLQTFKNNAAFLATSTLAGLSGMMDNFYRGAAELYLYRAWQDSWGDELYEVGSNLVEPADQTGAAIKNLSDAVALIDAGFSYGATAEANMAAVDALRASLSAGKAVAGAVHVKASTTKTRLGYGWIQQWILSALSTAGMDPLADVGDVDGNGTNDMLYEAILLAWMGELRGLEGLAALHADTVTEYTRPRVQTLVFTAPSESDETAGVDRYPVPSIGDLSAYVADDLPETATHTVGPGRQYATIQAAVDASTPGDSIEIFPKGDGEYYEEPVRIATPNLTLFCRDRENPAVAARPEGEHYLDYGFRIAASGVRLYNMRILRTVTGIILDGADNCTIGGNHIQWSCCGIAINNGNNNVIEGNRIYETLANALRVERGYGNRIFSNALFLKNGVEGGAAAYDGGANAWDDGNSTGNAWSDYSGTGSYCIAAGKEKDDRVYGAADVPAGTALELKIFIEGLFGNDDYTVDIYFGDPANGGQCINDAPLDVSRWGSRGIARMTWDTSGYFGPQDIYATLLVDGGNKVSEKVILRPRGTFDATGPVYAADLRDIQAGDLLTVNGGDIVWVPSPYTSPAVEVASGGALSVGDAVFSNTDSLPIRVAEGGTLSLAGTQMGAKVSLVYGTTPLIPNYSPPASDFAVDLDGQSITLVKAGPLLLTDCAFPDYGLSISGASGVSLEGVTCRELTLSNMDFSATVSGRLRDSAIEKISLSGCNNFDIENMDFSGTETPLFLSDCENITVEACTFNRTSANAIAGEGLLKNIVIRENVFAGCEGGIEFSIDNGSSHIDVSSNSFDGLWNSSFYGIAVAGTSLLNAADLVIGKNIFSDASSVTGLRLQNVAGAKVHDNVFDDLDCGMSLIGCNSVVSWHNSFIYCSAIDDGGNQWSFEGWGNYWYDHVCSNPDPVHPGVCLDAYGNDNGVSDEYPLTGKGAPAGVVEIPQTAYWDGLADHYSCYDDDGYSIDCAGSGQDGDARAGVAWPEERFTELGDGTVRDNLTGLVWYGDGNPVGSHYPAFDGDGNADGRVTWHHALAFVAGVNDGTFGDCAAGYNDWRLPNVNELISLMENDEFTTAQFIGPRGFNNVPADALYWSSTCDNNADFVYAWGADFGETRRIDRFFRDEIGVSSPDTLHVLLVRGGQENDRDPLYPANVAKTGQGASHSAASGDDGDTRRGVAWPDPRFVDNGDGTVTDALTGLVWMKNASPAATAGYSGGTLTWRQALDFVAALNDETYYNHEIYPNLNAGYADWRLPNFKELESLVDFSRYDPSLAEGHPFINVAGSCWSSTNVLLDPSMAYYVSFSKGRFGRSEKANEYALWPVRGGRVEKGNDPVIGVNRSVRDFGSVDVGADPSYDHVLEVTIGNSGAGDLTLGPVYLFGGDRDDFYFLYHSPPSNAVIMPSQQIQCSVGFAPLSRGVKKTFLIITSDDPHYPSVTVPLTGTGIAHTLTVDFSGNGSGEVEISAEGYDTIRAREDTELVLNPGTLVRLYPLADEGTAAGQWSGACTGTGSATLTMDGDTQAVITFTLRTLEIVSSIRDTEYHVAGGRIDPAGTTTVNYGGDSTYRITPDTYYNIADLRVDGLSAGVSDSYIFTGVTEDHTIEAVFELQKFIVTGTAGAHGTISPSGPQVVDATYGITFDITPDEGYHVADVTDNGLSVGAVSSYEIGIVEEDHIVEATFAVTTYSVTPCAAPHVVFTPSETQTVPHGGSCSFSVDAETGYAIADVCVNGVSIGAVDAWTFDAVTSDQTICAVAVEVHRITATAGYQGAIAPAGVSSFPAGSDATFVITPDVGYEIDDVRIDGVSIGAVDSYTFSDIHADHTIDVSFRIRTFTVDIAAGAGGAVIPAGSRVIEYGDSLVIAITPDEGFETAQVVVDGTDRGPVAGSLLLSYIEADHVVEVVFHEISYPITPAFSGQRTSYAQGDDGDLHVGPPWPEPRFTDNGDGTITDHYTGLMWIGRIDLFGDLAPTWQDTFALVQSLNVSSQNYVNYGYSASYNDWRVPNVFEMTSLVMNGRESNVVEWLNSFGFSLYSMAFWTSTSFHSSSASAYRCSLGASAALSTIAKTNHYFFLPVRGRGSGSAKIPKTGQTESYATGDDGDLQRGLAAPAVRFKENGDGTVTDSMTGLQWLKKADPVGVLYPSYDTFGNCRNEGRVSWQMALDFIAGINDGTYRVSESPCTDWRMPAIYELASLFDVSKIYSEGGTIPGMPFEDVRSMYWSSTSRPADPATVAWVGNFWEMRIDAMSKEADMNGANVWPVRTVGLSDMEVSLSADADPVLAGEALTYTITVTNRGPDDAQSVRIVDTFPQDALFISADAGEGTVNTSDGEAQFVLSGLAAGASATVTLTLKAPRGADSLMNDATVKGPNIDPDESNNAVHMDTEVTRIYTFTLVREGNGGGVVLSIPGGIECGDLCSAEFLAGTEVTLLATPDETSNFGGFTGVESWSGTTCTISVDRDREIGAVFTLKRYTVTAIAGAGGTIWPPGASEYDHGTSGVVYTIDADWGHYIEDVHVDGVSQGPIDSYTFDDIASDHTVEATFGTVQYTISADAGSGGWIDPSGEAPVYHGGDLTFTIGADEGFHVSSVIVDGLVLPEPVDTYTFIEVTNDYHSIAAWFEANRYIISATAGAGGYIDPAGDSTVTHGGEITYYMGAGANYHLEDVLVDGLSVGPVETYVFSNVNEGHAIEARFALNEHEITPVSSGRGKILPSEPVYLEDHESYMWMFVPDPGASLIDVAVDGMSVLAAVIPADPLYGMPAHYTLSDVIADHVIEAVFSSEYIRGDFNNDGEVGLADSVILLQVIAGTVPDDCFVTGDVNGDGKAGVEDLIYTLRKSAGLP